MKACRLPLGVWHKTLPDSPGPSLVQNPWSLREARNPLLEDRQNATRCFWGKGRSKRSLPQEEGTYPLGPGWCTNTKRKPVPRPSRAQRQCVATTRRGRQEQRRPGLQALLGTEACPGEQRLVSLAVSNRRQQSTSEMGQEHGERPLLWCRDYEKLRVEKDNDKNSPVSQAPQTRLGDTSRLLEECAVCVWGTLEVTTATTQPKPSSVTD